MTKKFSFAISQHVYKEAVENGKDKNAPDAYAIDARIAEGLIPILPLKSSRTVDDLTFKFGTERGESETVALYLERKTGIVECLKEFNLKFGLVITKDHEAEEVFEGKRVRFVPLWKWLLLMPNLASLL